MSSANRVRCEMPVMAGRGAGCCARAAPGIVRARMIARNFGIMADSPFPLCRMTCTILYHIEGHARRPMLEWYSHVRRETGRRALETLTASARRPGKDANHDTNVLPLDVGPV